MKFDLRDYDPEDFLGKSGIYFMYGEDDEMLYIGRAKNVRHRLSRHVEIHKEKRPCLSLLNEDIGGEDLALIISDLEATPPIDLFLEKVKKVEVAEIPWERTEDWEKVLIRKINPPFNKQDSDDYSDEDYVKLRNKIQRIKENKVAPERERRLREAFGRVMTSELI